MLKYIIIAVIFCMSPVFAQNNLYERHQESLLSLIQNNHQQKSTVERPRLGLVLSGGGARGISHVGVLKGFEKHDIPIDLIVGTSMGSVVGGFYAAGYSAEQLQKIIRSIDWNTIFSDATERENLFMGQKVESDRYLINLRFDGLQAYLPSSISSGQKILSIISDRLLKAEYQALSDFNNMKIPFRSIATDLVSGKRVVLSRGDLAEAINASVAVPLLFAPVRWDEMLLVDGGLSSNFAVDVARDFGMDLVVVVDITSPLRKRDEIRAPWEVADQVTTIMMQSQYEEQLSLADIVVRPDLEGIGSTDFAKYDEMIVQGEAAIDAIAEKLISATATTPYTVQIDSIRICGFQQLDEKLNVVNHFNSQLSAPKKEQVTLAMIKNDVDWLFGHGTFQAINARLADTTLTYIVTSNSKLNQIVISGNTIYPDSVIRGEISHPLQQVLNHNKIRDDLKSIRAMYQKDGYMLMDFNHIDFDSLNGILSVTIDEGHVDSIRISGNDLTERLVVLREFPLEPGDVINSKLIKRGIDNIYNTQLFEKVSANIDRSELGFILTIKLIEKKYTVLRLGGKVDSERGGQNYMELAHENLLGIGGKFSLLGRFGERDRNASINFRVDRIFRSFLTGGLHMYYHRLVNPVANIRSGEYVEERLGGRITIGQQLRKLGQMSVELRLENVKIFRESGSFTQSQDSDLRSITIRSVTDKRDKIGFTTKGIYNVWFWESGDQRFLGGQEKFTKAYINLEGYYTYWNNHTFHVRGVIGIGDKTLPFSEYFRIGGFNSFIGLHDYEFIGRQTILTNLEYRYKLPFQILADTFVGLRYDIGGIWEIPDLVLKGEDFFQGTGIWFGIDTFLGPLIIGAGDTNIRKAVVYLSLGYNF